MRVSGTVVPEETGIFQLALAQAGLARLLVNDEVVLDGFTNRPPPGGNDFFGQASQDLVADVHFEKDVPVDMVVEYAFSDTSLAGFRVGFRTADGDALLERAVAAAAAADVAIVCVGTSAETETEGRDRTTLALPGRQAELVRRVAAANNRTVVVVNAAAPVDMEWADDVAAVLQCWFGGQEMAGGLVDVLVGTAEPGGRLPTTLPIRLEHAPSHANFPGENGQLRYGEGLFMGYRGYEHNCDRSPVPVRPRPELHVVRSGRADVVDDDPPARGNGHGERSRDERRDPRRLRGRAVLRRAGRHRAWRAHPRSSRPSARSRSTRARQPSWSWSSTTVPLPTGIRARTTGTTSRPSSPRCSTSCPRRRRAGSAGGRSTPVLTKFSSGVRPSTSRTAAPCRYPTSRAVS